MEHNRMIILKRKQKCSNEKEKRAVLHCGDARVVYNHHCPVFEDDGEEHSFKYLEEDLHGVGE